MVFGALESWSAYDLDGSFGDEERGLSRVGQM